jgi:hypothetical protein
MFVLAYLSRPSSLPLTYDKSLPFFYQLTNFFFVFRFFQSRISDHNEDVVPRCVRSIQIGKFSKYILFLLTNRCFIFFQKLNDDEDVVLLHQHPWPIATSATNHCTTTATWRRWRRCRATSPTPMTHRNHCDQSLRHHDNDLAWLFLVSLIFFVFCFYLLTSFCSLIDYFNNFMTTKTTCHTVESPLELKNRIAIVRRKVCQPYTEAHAHVHGWISTWVGVEHAVECSSLSYYDYLFVFMQPFADRTKSIISANQSIATLTDYYYSMRMLATRFLLPPIFLFASA